MAKRTHPLVAAALIVIVAAAAWLSAADRPRNHSRRPKESAELQTVSVGAIKIPLRDVQQEDDYSCGAACMMAVCSYYNVGAKNLEGFKRKMHTDSEDGTYYRNMRKYAKSLGLHAEIEKPMSLARLKECLDAGKPVICSLQAYSDDKPPDYTKDGNGHYVVAIGYEPDQSIWYFMDPSANYEGARANPRYGCLTRADLEQRWHEDEGIKGEHERYSRLGIIICPEAAQGGPLLRARKIE
jgi:predicted double-glycine peptidase